MENTSALTIIAIIIAFVVVGWVMYHYGYCAAAPVPNFNDCFIKRLTFGLIDYARLAPRTNPAFIP